MPRAQCTGAGGWACLKCRARAGDACVRPSDGLLSYSDTWRTVIGQEHPSGHLVCGPGDVYVQACVSACIYMCVCVRARVHVHICGNHRIVILQPTSSVCLWTRLCEGRSSSPIQNVTQPTTGCIISICAFVFKTR